MFTLPAFDPLTALSRWRRAEVLGAGTAVAKLPEFWW